MDLVWNVNFEKQVISGEAVLHFDIVAKEIERIVSNCVHLKVSQLRESAVSNFISLRTQQQNLCNKQTAYLAFFFSIC